MATEAATQAALGVVGNCVEILRRIDDGTKTHTYVSGGAAFPGRVRWVDTNSSDNDATQAAAILANLAIP